MVSFRTKDTYNRDCVLVRIYIGCGFNRLIEITRLFCRSFLTHVVSLSTKETYERHCVLVRIYIRSGFNRLRITRLFCRSFLCLNRTLLQVSFALKKTNYVERDVNQSQQTYEKRLTKETHTIVQHCCCSLVAASDQQKRLTF